MKKRIQKNFRHILLFICLSGILFMTGCHTEKPHRQDEVMEIVKEKCTEDFKLLYSEKIRESPYYIRYTFETTDRKLTFTADSTLHVEWLVLASRAEIYCNYADKVAGLYRDRINAELEQSSLYKDGEFAITHYSDLEEAAKTLEKCNQIYAEELAYNSAEFLKENPASCVQFVWYRSENRKNGKEVFDCDINGCDTYKELLASLSLKYAQCYKDHIILDGSDIPQVYLDSTHTLNLKISINGEITDVYCQYDYDKDSYTIAFYFDSIPTLCKFMEKSGIDYTVNSKNTTIKWKTKTDTWEFRVNKEGRHTTASKPSLIRNGKVLSDIKEKGLMDQSYLNVTLDDFADMLDLEYTIDEDNSTIFFVSRD